MFSLLCFLLTNQVCVLNEIKITIYNAWEIINLEGWA